MIIPLLQVICKPIFGQFEHEEFKKFLRMGLIFACIIGSYWTLRVLKDSIFNGLVTADDQPWAKTASIICLFPLIMGYSKLLDLYSRERVFYILAITYAIATVIFALLLMSPFIGQAAPAIVGARQGFAYYGTRLLGYSWYIFVESYGSLLPALFWGIATDITVPDSAKKGFPLVVAIAQVGGIVGPKYIGKLPNKLGHAGDSLSVFICAGLVLSLVLLLKYFMSNTPKELLASFHGKNEAQAEKEQEPGFFEGLKLLFSQKYLIGIFAVVFFFEAIVTVFDFHFKKLAAMHYTGLELTDYLSDYASSVNAVALICLLLGVSNITRILGVGTALALMPIIVGLAMAGFVTFSGNPGLEGLQFLCYLMVGSKAINYALNGPAMKQLYIPTTHDVRFKSQAWIETFGSRGSKAAGSGFNMLLKPLQKTLGPVAGRAAHVAYASYLGFAIVTGWFFIALFLGRTFKKAVDNKTVVC